MGGSIAFIFGASADKSGMCSINASANDQQKQNKKFENVEEKQYGEDLLN